MDLFQTLELALLVIFIMLSAFFSASESALMSVSKVKIRHAVQEGDDRARTVDLLLKNPSKLLTTILVGNNVVNIASSALATTLALHIWGPQGALISTVVMTFAVLIFGEIAPKTFATQNAERIAYFSSPYLLFLSAVIKPLIRVLVKITNLLVRLAGGDPHQERPFVTEDEIIRFVNVGEEEGVIEEGEKEMIHSIFEFDDTVVREIMVPRIDIVAVEVDIPLREAVELIIEHGHSRIPVYNGTIDNIIGILYAKDLLQFVHTDYGELTVSKLLRRAYYVPENKKVNQLLSELRKERVHMAILLDEYGGTAGIVTIEDLIEEIVGDIQDEYDVEDADYSFISNAELIIDAGMPIDEFNDLLNVSLPEEDYDTVGGVVLSILGHLPVPGEQLEYDHLILTIQEMTGHRILKIHVALLNPMVPDPTEEEG